MHRPITTANRAVSFNAPTESVIGTALRWVAVNTSAFRRAQARVDARGIHF